MQTTIEVPYEFEALALYMGTTPKKAAQAVLSWFANPLRKTELVVPPTTADTPEDVEFRDAADHFAASQGMSRCDALDRMATKRDS